MQMQILNDKSTHAQPDNTHTQPGAIQVREYRIYPLFEAIVIGLGAFTVIALTTYFIFYHALEAQKGEIREGISRTASVLSRYVDVEKHKTFVDRKQEKTAAYRQALQPFELALEADPTIVFIYTGILKNDKVYFILDPTPEGDADGDGVDDKAHIMDEYPEVSEEMVTALKEQKIVVSEEPYTDRWGSFVSAYAPFYDKNKKFAGVLGLDISADTYFERLAPIKRATIRAFVAGFFISFLMGIVTWFTRNFAAIINYSRLRIINKIFRSTR